LTENGQKAYVMAIIDALTEYDCKKKCEWILKRVRYCGNSMSCVSPKTYSKRFVEFCDTIFVAESTELNQTDII
jgi:hypothetical protein